MDENIASRIARRASPYGLAVVPERDTYEYTDPRNEAAVEQRWRPICEDHGATVLGIRDVPTTPVRLTIDGIEWELTPFGTAERDVPAVVFNLATLFEVSVSAMDVRMRQMGLLEDADDSKRAPSTYFRLSTPVYLLGEAA